MELVYADAISYDPYLQLKEIGTVEHLISFEMLQSLSHAYEDNDFELQLYKEDWIDGFLKVGGWLYIPNTEWVGRIENIEHVEGIVKLTGPTLRGIISRWAIIPPSHFDKSKDPYVRFNMDIGKVPEYLLSTYNSSNNIISLRDAKRIFLFSQKSLGTKASYQYRYTNTLRALNQVAELFGHRLSVTHTYDVDRFCIQYEPIQDYSDIISFDDDYQVGISSKKEQSQAYNVVVGLGSGNLANRDTVTKYRLPNGKIVDSLTTTQRKGFEAKVYIYDYGAVESIEELEKGVIEKLKELQTIEEVSIQVDPEEEIFLGDIVGGRDEVTDLNIKERITEKRLTIDSNGYQIEYKAGGN